MTARVGRVELPRGSRPVLCAGCGGWPATGYGPKDSKGRRERFCPACTPPVGLPALLLAGYRRAAA